MRSRSSIPLTAAVPPVHRRRNGEWCMVPSNATPQLYRKVAGSINLGRTQRVFSRGTGTQLMEHEFIVLQEINNHSSSHEIIGMKHGM